MVKKTAKILAFCLILIITFFLANHSYASNEIIRINFKDKNIYNEIINQISDRIFYKDEEYLTIDIPKEELQKIKEISLHSTDAILDQNADLQGIERFTSIQKLEIFNYKVEDISAIRNLKNLTDLKINNCQLDDISPLEGLTNLIQLDLAQNEISDISSLKNLTNIEKLKLNRNQIADITPLKKLTKLNGLDISSNQIQDISSLKNLKELTLSEKTYDLDMLPDSIIKLINFEYLYLDNNQIKDLSVLDKEILKCTSARNQRIVLKTNKKEIDLPNVFLNQENIELSNCTLNDKKTKIITKDSEKETIVKIGQGILEGTILRKEYDIDGPSLMLIYGDVSEDNLTSTVTINSNEEIKPIKGWTLSESKNQLIKTYTKNMTEKIKVYDLVGNSSKATIQVKNVNLPIIKTEYTVTDDVTVTKGREIIEEADKYVGKVPYVLQGDSLTDGIDCSHFVYRILQICGLYDGKYVRSTNWINLGEPVEDLSHAIAGDVIVWDGHVAFYDGYGKIVEAKGKKWGLTHDRDAETAIKKSTYMGIRRFTGHQKIQNTIYEGQATNKDVKITIKSSKKIKPIKGWKLSSDGKALIKTYTNSIDTVIKINDYDGNTVKTRIVANIYK